MCITLRRLPMVLPTSGPIPRVLGCGLTSHFGELKIPINPFWEYQNPPKTPYFIKLLLIFHERGQHILTYFLSSKEDRLFLRTYLVQPPAILEPNTIMTPPMRASGMDFPWIVPYRPERVDEMYAPNIADAIKITWWQDMCVWNMLCDWFTCTNANIHNEFF